MNDTKEVIISRPKQKILSKIPLKISLNEKLAQAISPGQSLNMAINEDTIDVKIKTLTIKKEFTFNVEESKSNEFELFFNLILDDLIPLPLIIILLFISFFSGDYLLLPLVLAGIYAFREKFKRAIVIKKHK